MYTVSAVRMRYMQCPIICNARKLQVQRSAWGVHLAGGSVANISDDPCNMDVDLYDRANDTASPVSACYQAFKQKLTAVYLSCSHVCLASYLAR